MNQRTYALYCLLLIGWPTVVQAKDVLVLRETKKLVSGEITKVSRDFVTIKSGGSSDDVPVEAIDYRSSKFRDDPSGLASVRAFYFDGQLEQALKKLETVKNEGRDFVQQDIAYYRAIISAKLALRGAASVTSAARDVGGFLKQHGNSFHFYNACEVMGDLAMSLGRAEVASKYYDRLTEARSKTIHARGSLLLGDALLKGGDTSKAREMYARCLQADDLRIQALGQLGAARCDAPASPNAAIAVIEKVIAENDSSDQELFARAYNALGFAYEAAGQTETALDAYLHTDLLFYRDAENHAEALYYLTKLWAEVNKPAEANKARQTLKQRYKSSIWAQQ